MNDMQGITAAIARSCQLSALPSAVPRDRRAQSIVVLRRLPEAFEIPCGFVERGWRCVDARSRRDVLGWAQAPS